MSAYLFVINLCVVVIISFFFNLLAKKTNIPSVLMLILLGLGIQQVLNYFGIKPEYFNTLEILGIVGLIMIVLEAALDLELKREKWPIIWKSFVIAFVSLVLSSVLITFVIQLFIQNLDFLSALIYAIPFSIMSSAIIIPSVSNLSKDKREFMIYESTFSDILGILFFYSLTENINANGAGEVAFALGGNIFLTLVISVVLSYALIYLIQNIRTEARFFLFLAVLVLLYAVAKLFHLSSLLIILMFGLLLRNHKVLLWGKLERWLDDEAIDGLFENFKMITIESSFLVRTFFFVVFGISLSLSTLENWKVWLMSGLFLVILYVIRYIMFYAVERRDIFPQIFLAPRGLISILLFFAIPEDFKVPEFESGALLVIIMCSSLIMAWSLISESTKSSNHGRSNNEIVDGGNSIES
ncbi:cation:proton antiporter [Sunxiuqinia elliptica]|uniref:Sodium/proton antiporter (CPA1 family) n=1 Tax=Sunxiuqinia elliptica TaxID=655355 RepID=A0A4R6GXW3_9BACT|nr:cation:proton antiporter [Sunxiuqinia elliptica]TDN99830.1 sodium/proton antiporter (CPA1 family) [Sunxiuqinia elliptica]TDO57022.1 sodium/proton antiporter (CPA1 family) [Sunxiuqinia elliptica]